MPRLDESICLSLSTDSSAELTLFSGVRKRNEDLQVSKGIGTSLDLDPVISSSNNLGAESNNVILTEGGVQLGLGISSVLVSQSSDIWGSRLNI